MSARKGSASTSPPIPSRGQSLPWVASPTASHRVGGNGSGRAASIGACRGVSGYDQPTAPIGPEPVTGTPDLRAAWHEALAAVGPDEGTGVRGMPDRMLAHLRDTYPIETAWEPAGRAMSCAGHAAGGWDARPSAIRATAESGAARRQ